MKRHPPPKPSTYERYKHLWNRLCRDRSSGQSPVSGGTLEREPQILVEVHRSQLCIYRKLPSFKRNLHRNSSVSVYSGAESCQIPS